ncbi:MAG: amino acid adenylation domain-containing protein, partial [Acutalibacteraceae bacterium]|nr:amino acid adenylation domain-containing protein [Acutalibacteraceae bacterium]
KESCLKAYENQEYPFEELVENVDVNRDMSRNPLFDVMLTLQNNEEADVQEIDVNISNAVSTNTISKIDLDFNIDEYDKVFVICLDYCTDLFSKETVQRMLDNYLELLRSITTAPELTINNLEMITAEERNIVLNQFNDTYIDYPRDKTVINLLEEKAVSIPDRIALKFKDQQLTFKELNERANQLGNLLRDKGIGAEDYVVLISDRSIEMLVSIYGIMKSGGAYVPLSTTTPKERIEYIIQDCSAKAVVLNTTDAEFDTDIPIIHLDDNEYLSAVIENPSQIIDVNNAAYMIYTSGTTGKPKGVVIEHRGLLNLLKSYEDIYNMTEDDIVLQFASYCFDQSVWDIFSMVWNGNAVCVLPEDTVRNPEKLAEYIANQNVTLTSLTPAYINILNPNDFPSLRLLDSSGEAGNLETLKKWCEAGKRVINTYGPTEVTVNTSSYEVTANSDKLPIGKPIYNTQTYIVNPEYKLCGIGVCGELCIAGDGVARCYFNSPELTAEKFVDNPFGNGKLYRSGDLARWLPDGNIEYLGRIDEQVKIRGFRIELGEIESRIREIEEVSDCAVIVRADKGGDKALYAYFISDIQLEIAEIRDKLGKSLPEYMIPAYMMQIDEIPVTTNGKLNKRALPEIESKITKEYLAPRTEAEKVICEVFGEILGVETVGINDGFFELGGHSLRATRLVNSIEERLGVKIALKDVFSHTTPEQLAKIVDSSTGEEYLSIPKAEEKEYYPMSSAQKRTFLIQQMEPEAVTYNMPQSMKLEGEVYPEKLKSALQEM